jgi:hypothetical protein
MPISRRQLSVERGFGENQPSTSVRLAKLAVSLLIQCPVGDVALGPKVRGNVWGAVVRFVVIARPRTGSNALTAALSRQPDILCNGEIFSPDRVGVRWDKKSTSPEALLELRELRERDSDAFMERVFATNYGCAHVGFKIFDEHNALMLKKLIEDESIRKIILFRRNVLAQYSSVKLAMTTGDWVAGEKKSTGQAQPPGKVLFKKKRFWTYCKKYLRFYADTIRQIEDARQSFHLINYDEVNNQRLFRALVRFIGADFRRVPIAGGPLKQNSSNIVSRFSNQDDVKEFLEASGLQHWAFEGEVAFSLRKLGSTE